MDLKDFTIDTFRPLVGSEFRIVFEDTTVSLTLREVRMVGTQNIGKRPEQFSVFLEGGEAGPLVQRIYSFDHDILGTFEMFIVPRLPIDGLFQYEASFS